MADDVWVNVNCPQCDGTGTVYEHHGPGLNEPMDCDCIIDTEGLADMFGYARL